MDLATFTSLIQEGSRKGAFRSSDDCSTTLTDKSLSLLNQASFGILKAIATGHIVTKMTHTKREMLREIKACKSITNLEVMFFCTKQITSHKYGPLVKYVKKNCKFMNHRISSDQKIKGMMKYIQFSTLKKMFLTNDHNLRVRDVRRSLSCLGFKMSSKECRWAPEIIVNMIFVLYGGKSCSELR